MMPAGFTLLKLHMLIGKPIGFFMYSETLFSVQNSIYHAKKILLANETYISLCLITLEKILYDRQL